MRSVLKTVTNAKYLPDGSVEVILECGHILNWTFSKYRQMMETAEKTFTAAEYKDLTMNVFGVGDVPREYTCNECNVKRINLGMRT